MKLLKPALLALSCALLLAGMNLQTRGVIDENQTFFEQKLLRQMVSELTNSPEIVDTETGYKVLDDQETVALIQPAVTEKGYNGDINLLVAYTTDREIISVRVTEHRETPGIGDDIDISISPWITQFQGKTADSEWSLAPAGEIDGITGATITSKAVTVAVSEVLTR